MRGLLSSLKKVVGGKKSQKEESTEATPQTPEAEGEQTTTAPAPAPRPKRATPPPQPGMRLVCAGASLSCGQTDDIAGNMILYPYATKTCELLDAAGVKTEKPLLIGAPGMTTNETLAEMDGVIAESEGGRLGDVVCILAGTNNLAQGEGGLRAAVKDVVLMIQRIEKMQSLCVLIAVPPLGEVWSADDHRLRVAYNAVLATIAESSVSGAAAGAASRAPIAFVDAFHLLGAPTSNEYSSEERDQDAALAADVWKSAVAAPLEMNTPWGTGDDKDDTEAASKYFASMVAEKYSTSRLLLPLDMNVDGIHLTTAGYDRLGEAVAAALLPKKAE